MRITYGLKRSALLYGGDAAIRDLDGTWTYREFLDRVQRMAGVLRSLGVGPGDGVAILMLNSHWYMEVMYATLWAGGVIVPLNTRHAAPEIVAQLEDCRPKLIVVDDTFVPMLQHLTGALRPAPEAVYCGSSAAPDGVHGMRGLLEEAAGIPDADRSDDDLMGIFYTGGTTGRSKGVMLSHRNVVSNTVNALIALRYEHSDTYLHVAPMFHLADAGTTWTITFAGACHAFIPGFEPDATLKAIRDYRVTKIILVPTMINMVINHPSIGKYDISSLKAVLYGASPIPTSVLTKAIDTLGCEFIQGYGMTESAQIATILPADDHRHPADSPRSQRLMSAGVPLPLTEVEVRDPDDRPLPQGEVGEICFRGPNVMQGYLNMPEATADALRGGWMHSGDVGYLDEHGYVYLVDRSKDMIVSGGENVYSTEVEAAVYTHPSVLEAAVIGIPHESWGEAVHAVVTLKKGMTATEREIIDHCHGKIAGYKCPKGVTFHDGELPKSGPGKILKRELRKHYWKGHERQIH